MGVVVRAETPPPPPTATVTEHVHVKDFGLCHNVSLVMIHYTTSYTLYDARLYPTYIGIDICPMSTLYNDPSRMIAQ